jgi:uncharacterized protein YoxC
MVYQISVAAIAIAFVVLVVYLIKTLKSLTVFFENTSQTLTRVEQQVGAVTSDSTELIQHAKEIVVDVQDKIKKLDSTFSTLKQSGEAAKEVTSSVRQVSSAVAQFIHSRRKPEPATWIDHLTEMMKTVPVLLEVWHKIKKSR